ncbi:hypothetical protein ACEWY4_001219 [Coilia grayii]|uniref:CDP-alcohol phosphatidyltransferase family protein n=1 Tax=Coilia grayii TaxID=363190 RepID=A0ABD1KYV6_9TELE
MGRAKNILKDSSLCCFRTLRTRTVRLKNSFYLNATRLLNSMRHLHPPNYPRHQYASCWLVLIGYLLDLADGAVARRLNACSALGAKLDDFADFTTFGIATSLLLRTESLLDNILCMCYVLSVFTRLCFFSSEVRRKRKEFSKVIDYLREKGMFRGFAYPHRLRVFHKGKIELFDNPLEVRSFIDNLGMQPSDIEQESKD